MRGSPTRATGTAINTSRGPAVPRQCPGEQDRGRGAGADRRVRPTPSRSASGARCGRTTAPTARRGPTCRTTTPAPGPTGGARTASRASATSSSGCASASRCGTAAPGWSRSSSPGRTGGARCSAGGVEKMQTDPRWRDQILFYEYFDGDNGAGLGASHQTGWTGLVADLIAAATRPSPRRSRSCSASLPGAATRMRRWWATPIVGTPSSVAKSGGESTLTVLLAMGANLAVGVAKLVAGLLTGSAAMLSEAAHSVGDTMTEVLLLTALKRSAKPPDRSTPVRLRQGALRLLAAGRGVDLRGGRAVLDLPGCAHAAGRARGAAGRARRADRAGGRGRDRGGVARAGHPAGPRGTQQGAARPAHVPAPGATTRPSSRCSSRTARRSPAW